MRSFMRCRAGTGSLAAGLLILLAAAAGQPALAQATATPTVATPLTPPPRDTRKPPPELPLEAFASAPLLSGVRLSPNGERIAAVLSQPDRSVLITRHLDGEKSPTVVLATENQQSQFNWAQWVSDERLVVSMRTPAKRQGSDAFDSRLFSVKYDGSGLVRLSEGKIRGLNRQGRIIDWLPDDGHKVLMALNEAGSPDPAVVALNVEDGKRRVVQYAIRNVYDWITDAQHRVRVALWMQDDRSEVRVREPDGKDWRTLWAFKEGDGNEVTPLGFGLDPQELFVQALHQGRLAVFSVRLDQPGLPRTLRLAHPDFDVEGALLRSPATGEVLGLRNASVEGDASGESRADLWDPAWRAWAKRIDEALPGRSNRLIGISREEDRYLVYSSGNGQPGDYLVGDRVKGQLRLIGSTYPALKPELLAGKHGVEIKARDGLKLNAFLTLPVGAVAKGAAPLRLPLVLLPHGGPHSRDNDDFDPWTEFLANRRYAVLQVNFRGSDGYGRQFKDAGLQRWGLEMQDDLSDAVAWAVTHGIADPNRVCIVGASYGGYAALMGLVKTPELYRCGASFAGVTDLRELIMDLSNYIGGNAVAERMFGRYWGDRDRLRTTSPALQAERIQAPVLLVHGTADQSVPVEQSRDMAKALKSAGKVYRYVEQEGGDHHLSRHEHSVQFMTELEKFLGEHLKPR